MSGLDFFRQIKEAGHDVPAILVTGLQDEQLLVEALRAGVRDFVPKTPTFSITSEPIVSRVIRQVSTERDLAESRVLAREHEVRRRELEHEIAQRKRVEQALREAEENLRLMVESIKDFAIFTVDPDGHDRQLELRRRAAVRLFRSRDPRAGASRCCSRPRTAPPKCPSTRSPRAAATGRATDERWHIRKDGSRFFASGVLAPIFDEDSKLRGFTKIARDITQRKQAEEAVREAAVRLKAIVDTAVDGIITIDEHGNVESMNLAAERIFGFARDEVIGSNITMLMPEPYRGEHGGYLTAYLSTGPEADHRLGSRGHGPAQGRLDVSDGAGRQRDPAGRPPNLHRHRPRHHRIQEGPGRAEPPGRRAGGRASLAEQPARQGPGGPRLLRSRPAFPAHQPGTARK